MNTPKTDSNLQVTSEPYKLDRISHSKAETFRKCAKKWKYQYIDKRILVTASWATTVGSFVHEVLEQFYNLPAAMRTKSAMKSLARSTFGTFSVEDEDYQLLLMDDITTKQFKLDAWNWLLGLWDLEDPEKIEVVATEQSFEQDIAGIKFRGAIDRIEQGPKRFIVSDFKTGKPPWGKYIDDKLIQILLYSAVVQDIYGERPEYAQLLFLGSKIIGVTPTPFKMEKQLQSLVDTWNDIETAARTDNFPANPNPLCGWCGHVDICTEGQEYIVNRFENGPKYKNAPPAYEILEL